MIATYSGSLRVSTILCIVFLTGTLVDASEKARAWQLGLLREMDSESWTSHSTAPVTCTYGSGCTGGGTSSWNHQTYTVQISDGEQTYVAERTLSFRWQHDPKVTENSLMRFAVESDQLILIGDDGREFKTHIKKKRVNSLADQLQECSMITKVLSHRVSGMNTLDLIIVLGHYARCGSLGATTPDIPLVQDVERSFSLLLSEEELRIARKDGMPAVGAAPPPAPTLASCNHVDSAASDLAPLAAVPDNELFALFHESQSCVAAHLAGAGGITDPASTRAQTNLASEGCGSPKLKNGRPRGL